MTLNCSILESICIIWSEERSACPYSCRRASNITQAPPGRVKCSLLPSLTLSHLPLCQQVGGREWIMPERWDISVICTKPALHWLISEEAAHFFGRRQLFICLFRACAFPDLTCTISLLSEFPEKFFFWAHLSSLMLLHPSSGSARAGGPKMTPFVNPGPWKEWKAGTLSPYSPSTLVYLYMTSPKRVKV